MEKDLSHSKEFIDAIRFATSYWDDQNDRSCRLKMEGLVHSILCMLDGCSGQFRGNLESLCKEGDDFMLHQMFYEKE